MRASDSTTPPAAATCLSAYGELDAPVFKTLDLNVAGRYDHYSDFGDAFSPKIEIKWTPIRQLAIRGTYSNGFRAPSFAEAHTGAVGGFETLNLCGGDAVEQAYCAAHGNDAYVQPYSLEAVNIDNPHIDRSTLRASRWALSPSRCHG